ncbi:L,D-transpeptidase-like protein [Azomonas agilis]|uniref:L,D-transpeptidase-like protein n=1 Tax=Azomonas agilis TaxID=116849 RepID=A0A562HZW1_9GAMM|nr:L,D-transpeptidase [Azomonas agilis]TWH64074.1 L,D-transpeptidase-like protein [Azomonas agilis]
MASQPILDLLHISLADQRLYAYAQGKLQMDLLVSTALNGAGELNGSGCTPRGLHQVRARIGEGLPTYAVLRGRRWTQEIWSPELHARFPNRDWVLSRILWLSGCELGFNRLGNRDTFRRYIYLHGTPESEPMGVARSHGCIRLHNADMVRLFAQVPVHCAVRIVEESGQPDMII